LPAARPALCGDCETICSTNPCGKQKPPPYDTCLLGSVLCWRVDFSAGQTPFIVVGLPTYPISVHARLPCTR
jgi:hypothetical protein